MKFSDFNIYNNLIIFFFPGKLILSNRGNTMLVIDNYHFSRHSETSKKVRWQCSIRSKHGCRAVAHTLEGKIVYFKNDHNHWTCFLKRLSFYNLVIFKTHYVKKIQINRILKDIFNIFSQFIVKSIINSGKYDE